MGPPCLTKGVLKILYRYCLISHLRYKMLTILYIAQLCFESHHIHVYTTRPIICCNENTPALIQLPHPALYSPLAQNPSFYGWLQLLRRIWILLRTYLVFLNMHLIYTQLVLDWQRFLLCGLSGPDMVVNYDLKQTFVTFFSCMKHPIIWQCLQISVLIIPTSLSWVKITWQYFLQKFTFYIKWGIG